jgi:hypothetical protein
MISQVIPIERRCNKSLFLSIALSAFLASLLFAGGSASAQLSISDIYPNGTNLFQPTNTFSFTVHTNSSLVVSKLVLTGAMIDGQPVSTNVNIVNYPDGRVYHISILTNAAYTAVFTVSDLNGNTGSWTLNFDTFSPVFTWEAEDYNYGGGQTVLFPTIDGYQDLAGVAEVDYHYSGTPLPPYLRVYRPDPVGNETCGDTPRLGFIATGSTNYDVGFLSPGDWLNYTRTFPAGLYNVVARAAYGSSSGATSIALSAVTSDPSQPSQTTADIGTFTVSFTGGWQTYAWVPMRDSGGNLVTFTGGSVQTLQATMDGDVEANFYMLIPAQGILTSAVSGNNILISFPTVPGRNYSVEYKNDLADLTWATLAGGSIAGNGNNRSVTDPIGGANRFYRLKIQ